MIIDIELANDFNRKSFESYFGLSPCRDGELIRWIIEIMEEITGNKKSLTNRCNGKKASEELLFELLL